LYCLALLYEHASIASHARSRQRWLILFSLDVMITGAHWIIYSTDAEADRRFLRDVLKLTSVDVGDGWLIFGLPPAEVAVHPSEENDVHEFYFMCDDVKPFIAEMKKHRVVCDLVQDRGYGLFTQLTLPGGGKLGVYQPRHARPKQMRVK
jgi:hypothetical protein